MEFHELCEKTSYGRNNKFSVQKYEDGIEIIFDINEDYKASFKIPEELIKKSWWRRKMEWERRLEEEKEIPVYFNEVINSGNACDKSLECLYEGELLITLLSEDKLWFQMLLDGDENGDHPLSGCYQLERNSENGLFNLRVNISSKKPFALCSNAFYLNPKKSKK